MKKYSKYVPFSGFPEKKGSALQVSISKMKDKDETVRLFIEMAPQVKDKPASGSNESPFSWDSKIFIALKEEEVGKLLACFRGRLPSVDIIHKFPIDAPPETQKTSTLSLKEGEYKGTINWQIQLRQKVGMADGVSLGLYLQPEDAEILVVLLQECVRQMYRL